MKSEFFAPVLVELLDAAYQQDLSTLRGLGERIQAYYLSLVQRFESHVPLLAASPEYESLQLELEEFFPRYSSALKGLLEVSSELGPEQVDELCCRCHRLELRLRELQERCQVLESELPELLGHPLLNEILILCLHRLHGHLEGLSGLAPRLVGLMEFLGKVEMARADFFSRFQEPELEAELVVSLTRLKEASGGLFVVLEGEGDETDLSQAAELLQRGANMAVLCLAQMQEIESRESCFSEDPLLERLYQSRDCEETASTFLQKLRIREIESAKSFRFLSEQKLYPAPYPAEELDLLREKRALLESSLDQLSAPVSAESLEVLREHFIAYDSAVDKIEGLLRSDFLPEEVPVFRHYLELLQNVSAGRAPLYLLSLHTEGFWNSLEEFWEHLESEEADEELFLSLTRVRDAFQQIEDFLEDGGRGRLQEAYSRLFSSARTLGRLAQAPKVLKRNLRARSSPAPLDIVGDMQRGQLDVSAGRRQLWQSLSKQEKSLLRLRELSAALGHSELGGLWEELDKSLGELRELLHTELDNNLLLRLERSMEDYLALFPQIQDRLEACLEEPELVVSETSF